MTVGLALAASLATACGDAGNDGGPAPGTVKATEENQTSNGRVASHGMIVVGDGTNAFLSHVPSFGPPHDVQAIVAGSIVSVNGTALPPSFSDQLFTFQPDSMSLDAFRTGSLRVLEGKLFVGSFEHDGRPLAGRFRFTAGRVLHQHVLEFQASQPSLTYFLFGTRDRTFAAHKIAGSPSFDEILRVDLGGDAPSNEILAGGVDAQVPGATDLPASRVGLAGSATAAVSGGRSFTMKRVAALSCLTGPDFFDFCK